MKASSIWPGTDYAWKQYLGRGQKLPLDAKRVKVIEKISEPIYGGKKSRTLVLVAFLDDEGAAITEGHWSQTQRIKAQDIINFWEEYEPERAERKEEVDRENEERRIREEKRRREYEERQAAYAAGTFIRNAALAMERWEREREQREKQERLEKHLQRITNVLITRGLQRNQFTVSEWSVSIPRTEVERWLGIESST